MSVCHYLFWKEKNKITTVLKNDNTFKIIKFGGYSAVEYKNDFWERWREYAGFLKGDFIDFCFVFDDECPQIPEYLKERECNDKECIWDKYAIQNIANIINVNKPIQIFNKEGICIAKAGLFRDIQKSDIEQLVAVYRSSEKEILPNNNESIEITPFIEDMLIKLKEYDKQ